VRVAMGMLGYGRDDWFRRRRRRKPHPLGSHPSGSGPI
jgi:hypothetical protein